MQSKVKSLLQQRKALAYDLTEAREELSYLNRVTKVHCGSVQRRRRHELERQINEMNQAIESIDYSLAEIQWEEGVPA